MQVPLPLKRFPKRGLSPLSTWGTLKVSVPEPLVSVRETQLP